MECLRTQFARQLGQQRHYISKTNQLERRISSISCGTSHSTFHFKLPSAVHSMNLSNYKNKYWKALAATVDLEEEEEPPNMSDDTGKLTLDEIKALLSDSTRLRLTKKLGEANQFNRFLKRQLQTNDDALVEFKSQLAVLELELQALVGLAEEVVDAGIPPDTRQINENYIHSHLLSRLQAVHKKIKEHIEDVDLFKFQDVTVTWLGMAESVQVMGSFNGWSDGEELSPEYLGAYTKFSATLKLRPGRYEIKFLVDGKWRLSSEFPTIGEGLMQNNVLVV